jgi:pyruvate dehydrogenase E2 component (dihydrolipoamide acetyltransferase)
MSEFRMPSLGADMEAGTLVEWLVKPGDPVKRGDIVAIVETQKGAIEIEIFQAGTIGEIRVDTGSKVPVGTVLATLTEAKAAAGAPREAPAPKEMPTPKAPKVAADAAPKAEAAPPPPTAISRAATPARAVPARPAKAVTAPTGAGRMRVSPAARRFAEARGVVLDAITGSGPGGSIVLADVEKHPAGAAEPTEKRPARGLDLNAMRNAIAAAMARSKRDIPHYYLSHDVTMAAAEEWLVRANAERAPDTRLLMNALTVKAVALAVGKFPAFNGFYQNGRFEPTDGAHVGVAIALRGGGLIAPAIHDTATLSLDDLMTKMRDLVQRARAGRIRGSEIADPTITVSSMGERGVETLYGVIYPPQVAIIGIGKIVTRPWVVDGAIGPRDVTTITLAADHRVSDGHAGALFLAEIGRLLQEPDKL